MGDASESGRFSFDWLRGAYAQDESPDAKKAKALWEENESRISKLLKTTVDPDTRYEIARIVNIMPSSVHAHLASETLNKLKLALDALEEPAPSAETARSIVRQIEITSRRNFTGVFLPFRWLIGNTALSAVLGGMVAGLVVVGAYTYAFNELNLDSPQKEIKRDLLWIAVFAYCGSVASLLLKLESFARERNYDPFLLFCTGACKPFIGIFFSVFAYAIFRSGFFTITGMNDLFDDGVPGGTRQLLGFLALVGFISGFSERFGPDLVARAESGFGGGGAQVRNGQGGGQLQQTGGRQSGAVAREGMDARLDEAKDGGRGSGKDAG